jgi:hypothetical protein
MSSSFFFSIGKIKVTPLNFIATIIYLHDAPRCRLHHENIKIYKELIGEHKNKYKYLEPTSHFCYDFSE